MSTGAPNAILAINSLDRYIASKYQVTSTFNAIWANNQNIITFTTGQPLPQLGASLQADGIPVGTTITAVNNSVSNPPLLGTWNDDSPFALIFRGAPIDGSFLQGEYLDDPEGQFNLDSIITNVAPFPSNNGYLVDLQENTYNQSGPREFFDAIWRFAGQPFIEHVDGPFPSVGDAIYNVTLSVIGIVTDVTLDIITFNGVTQDVQAAPQTVYFRLPVPIRQQTDVVTISANTTNAQPVSVVVTQTYLTSKGQAPTSNALVAAYQDSLPYCNDFTIQSPSALIYGYIQRIVVSQIQVQCCIPTVCLGKNDLLLITSVGTGTTYRITIPWGFYTGAELAAALDAIFAATPGLADLSIAVTYQPLHGFVFESKAVPPKQFYFPSSSRIANADIDNALKTYRLLGITVRQSEVPGIPQTTQTSGQFPNFLYTPYIDFYSDILTNYQTIKDTNTSVAKPKGLVARVYLSGNGNVQTTTSIDALGSRPFVVTADLNSPKIIKWTPETTIPSIDFQLRDSYGDFIPGPLENYSTEFQMTLLCIEGEEWRTR